MTNVKPVVVSLLIVLGLGVGFSGGYFFRNYQLTKLRGNFPIGANANGVQRFNGVNRGMGQNIGLRSGAVQGSILSIDDKSITVKMVDGSSKIVLFSDSTKYTNTISANSTDLKVGGEVSVFGPPNSDGSITATNVQLNPIMFRPQATPVIQK